jgi:5'-deoxynucleotidase YfbR-like HD superfamily hydrolase
MHADVTGLVAEILKDLSDVNVIVEKNQKINILLDLAHTPRSGKSTRIDRYQLNLPKRSILDHITSLAFQSEVYRKICNLDIDTEKLASFIAFHDIAEALMGDVPDFTPRRLAKKLYKTKLEKEDEEEIANTLIANAMDEDLRVRFVTTIEQLKDTDHTLVKFFQMVDKTDPIIGVWRYIHLYKNQIDIDIFLDAMSDFFTNPKVVGYCTNEEIKSIIKFLQNKKNANDYYVHGSTFLRQQLSAISLNILIENRDIMYSTDFHILENK